MARHRSADGLSNQSAPGRPWHTLYFLPEPQKHGAFLDGALPLPLEVSVDVGSAETPETPETAETTEISEISVPPSSLGPE